MDLRVSTKERIIIFSRILYAVSNCQFVSKKVGVSFWYFILLKQVSCIFFFLLKEHCRCVILMFHVRNLHPGFELYNLASLLAVWVFRWLLALYMPSIMQNWRLNIPVKYTMKSPNHNKDCPEKLHIPFKLYTGCWSKGKITNISISDVKNNCISASSGKLVMLLRLFPTSPCLTMLIEWACTAVAILLH